MKTLKDYIQDVKSRFKLVAVIAVLTVILGIWYIGVFSLDEIGQFISIYQNVATWNLKKEHIYYSNFEIFKKNVINGSHELNKTKVHYIVIYGEMLASINKDVKSCPVNNCLILTDVVQWVNADLILIPNKIFPPGKRPKHQAWVAYDYESPLHSRLSTELNDKINFTATYRFDSTIRTPYGMYTPNSPEDNNNDNRSQSNKMKNIAAAKDKLVAWMVSNCNAPSPRFSYANDLAKYIKVDVYGQCGQMSCGKSKCFEMLRDNYKFYLSFENSLCQDYITEKFFFNALMNNVLPIVMGASIEEYLKVSPPHSFIHVDQFANPKELAKYLHYLNSNDTAYNEYFAWHNRGFVTMWSSKPECEFCLLANALPYLRPTTHQNFSAWWRDGCSGRTLRWK